MRSHSTTGCGCSTSWQPTSALAYLWILRAFDRARANYQVLLHTPDVAAQLAELAAEHPECPAPDDLAAALDALVDWGNLDRGQDAARAATVQEYRNRHSVYQLTDAGYRAYQAVEQVLAARLDDATLSRLVFPDILADLHALAAASAAGDAEEVYRKLTRLDRALADMAERAARFYLLLGELARTTDHRRRGVPRPQGRAAGPHARVPRRAAALQPAAARGDARRRGHRRRADAGAGRRGRRPALPHPGGPAGRLAAALGRAGGLVRRRTNRPQ